MRKKVLITLLLLLPCIAGCSLYDTVFDIFGGGYTSGGPTKVEKEWEYERQVEKWQGRDPDFATQ